MKLIIISISALFFLSIATAVIVQFNQDNSHDNSFQFNTQDDMNSTGTPQQFTDANLYGEWKWSSSIDSSGKTVTPKNSDDFVLTFTKEGKLSSTTDCNSLGGSFVKNGEVLSIGPLTSTLMACSGETFESEYASELASVVSYKIEGKILTLILIKDLGTMTFTRE